MLAADIKGAIGPRAVAENRFGLSGQIRACAQVRDVVRDVSARICKQQRNTIDDRVFELAIRLRAVEGSLDDPVLAA